MYYYVRCTSYTVQVELELHRALAARALFVHTGSSSPRTMYIVRDTSYKYTVELALELAVYTRSYDLKYIVQVPVVQDTRYRHDVE